MPPIFLEYLFTPDIRLVLEIYLLRISATPLAILICLSWISSVPPGKHLGSTSIGHHHFQSVCISYFAGRPTIDPIQSESLTAVSNRLQERKRQLVRRRLIALIVSTSGIRVAYTVFTCTARGGRNCVKVDRLGLATASSLRKPTARTSRLESVIKEQSNLAHAVPVPLTSQNPLALHPEDGGNK